MSGRRPGNGEFRLRLTFAGSPEGVRSALGEMRAFLQRAGTDEDAAGTAEIVLAEALNNVAEHAYATMPEAPISLDLDLSDAALHAEITDAGAALPQFRLPEGSLPDLGRACDPPEGGFGWFLIRQLSSTLDYRRQEGRNVLRIEIPRGALP